jgi:serine phosphatase RsbU (regulator of sigma subunit)
MHKPQWYIPIKYKLLGGAILVLATGMLVFFYLMRAAFVTDRKLFVTDLNTAVLDAASESLNSELSSRLRDVQEFTQSVYEKGDAQGSENLKELLPSDLASEMIDLTVYQSSGNTNPVVAKSFLNHNLLTQRKLPDALLSQLTTAWPVKPRTVEQDKVPTIVNHSLSIQNEGKKNDLPIFAFVLSGNIINSQESRVIVVANFFQDCLRRSLAKSEIAELFVVSKQGQLLAHSNPEITVEYATRAFSHPALASLNQGFSREALEGTVNKEPYLINVAETGFKDLLMVSQIKKSVAYQAIYAIERKGFFVLNAVLYIAALAALLFSRYLTKNIYKLRDAAEQIGTGNFDVKIAMRTKDEISDVAKSFLLMVEHIKDLMMQTREKARMENELETAKLVQSALLDDHPQQSSAIEIEAYYTPASEIGGDLWDAKLVGNSLTVLVGDATGHGAAGAIVTAVTKSSFNTVNYLYGQEKIAPDQFLTILNSIVHASCKGKLLMTMFLIQLDLETGELTFSNAGHEGALYLKSGDGEKKKADTLFLRGERLGFDPTSAYSVDKIQLVPGDTLLLYTDGVTESKNAEGKDWGERSLRKFFATHAGMPLNQLKNLLTAELGRYTNNAPPQDDVTFVLVRWTGKLSVQEALTTSQAA